MISLQRGMVIDVDLNPALGSKTENLPELKRVLPAAAWVFSLRSGALYFLRRK